MMRPLFLSTILSSPEEALRTSRRGAGKDSRRADRAGTTGCGESQEPLGARRAFAAIYELRVEKLKPRGTAEKADCPRPRAANRAPEAKAGAGAGAGAELWGKFLQRKGFALRARPLFLLTRAAGGGFNVAHEIGINRSFGVSSQCREPFRKGSSASFTGS
jgi:hypothetical protein